MQTEKREIVVKFPKGLEFEIIEGIELRAIIQYEHGFFKMFFEMNDKHEHTAPLAFVLSQTVVYTHFHKDSDAVRENNYQTLKLIVKKKIRESNAQSKNEWLVEY